MWKLVGMTMLLSRAVVANINEENDYYLSAREQEDRLLEGLEKSRGTTTELATSELTRLDKDENRENEPLLDYSKLKTQPKRSINRINLRERTSELREAPASLATLLFWPERQDRVIHEDAQKRRNPTFRLWGGKRDLDRYKTITKIRRPVRVPFNSWGGKRSSLNMDSPSVDPVKGKLPQSESKTPQPFNSWGGKRRSIEFHQGYDEPSKHPYDFDDPLQMDEEDFNNFRGQPTRFEKLINNGTEGKRGSLKLIGSNQITTSGSTVRDHFARVPFEPWGGKKRGELPFDDDDPRSPSVSLIFRKIGQLFPQTE